MIFRTVEIVGLLAFATNVAGNLMLARKSERGWGLRIVSIILWFVYARDTSSIAMTANSVTFLGINIYGLLKWRKERAHEFVRKLKFSSMYGRCSRTWKGMDHMICTYEQAGKCCTNVATHERWDIVDGDNPRKTYLGVFCDEHTQQGYLNDFKFTRKFESE